MTGGAGAAPAALAGLDALASGTRGWNSTASVRPSGDRASPWICAEAGGPAIGSLVRAGWPAPAAMRKRYQTCVLFSLNPPAGTVSRTNVRSSAAPVTPANTRCAGGLTVASTAPVRLSATVATVGGAPLRPVLTQT